MGTGGSTFNISSVASTHTFNIPNASVGEIGLVTTSAQTFAGVKSYNTSLLVTSGGVGITGASVFHTSLTSVGPLIGSTTLSVTGVASFASNVNITVGGLGVTGGFTVSGATVLNSNTNSTSSTNGAMTIVGGLGVAGNINVGSGFGVTGVAAFGTTTLFGGIAVHSAAIQVTSGGLGVTGGVTFSSTTLHNGVATFATNVNITSGGLGVTGGLTVSGASIFNSNTNSTSSTNGALTVVGGVGISGNLNIGSGLGVTGAAVFGSTSLFNGVASHGAAVLVTSGGIGVTGASIFHGALQASSLTLVNALTIANGGTGLNTTPAAYTLLTANNAGTGYTQKTLLAGSGITISQGVTSITLTATGAGGGTPGGTNDGDIQYKSGSSFAAATTLNYESSIGQLSVSSFPLSTVASTSAALKILGTSQSWSGSNIGTFLGINAAVGFVGDLIHAKVNNVERFRVDGNGAVKINNAFTLPTTDGTANQVLQTNGSGTVSWATASGSGSGTVGAAAAGSLAWYSAAGTAVTGASALVYATSTNNLTITASGAAVTPLELVGAASQSQPLFTVASNGPTVQFELSSAGAVSTGRWNGSAIGHTYGGTGLVATPTNGQIPIGNGNGYTLAGIGVTGLLRKTDGAGSITLKGIRAFYMTFCAGYTPLSAGVDTVIIRIPDNSTDAVSSITYNVREFEMRVETPSSGTTTVQCEYYTGTSAFVGTNLLSAGLSMTGTGNYEVGTTSFTTPTLSTGTKLRVNFTALNATHANFFIRLMLEEQ